MKVCIISGGFSKEQHSSRKTGKCVAKALEKLGHDVAVIEFNETLTSNLKAIDPDFIFPLVQGKHHGDGAVQALLELNRIPYVGSRPHSAAVINHKTLCKKIWRAENILTPDFFEYSCDEYKDDSFTDFERRVKKHGLKLPVVIKPPTQGSRFGMVFVNDSESFDKLAESFRHDQIMLVEAYVEGRFFTQGIIEIEGVMTALPPVEVLDDSRAEFKLYVGGSTVRSHDFSPEDISKISCTTLLAASLTGASGFARLDYHLSGGKLYLLEINAVPGLEPGYSSMVECALAGGYEYTDFIAALLKTAQKNEREERQ